MALKRREAGDAKLEFKSVKVPKWAYDNALRAQTEVNFLGLDVVPWDLREPEVCPSCGGAVTVNAIGYRHVSCGGCGYQQQTLSASGDTAVKVGIGLLLGLGVAALLQSSGSGRGRAKQKQLAPRPTRKRLGK